MMIFSLKLNLLFITTILIQINNNLFTNAKCIMKNPCSSHKNLQPGQSPFESKWYNCRYDDEPVPLTSAEAIDDLKKLCSPLYKGDNTPVCCNAEQLSILKKDIISAEALIGSCSSCYFNFRMMWCHYSCSPNQADFVIEREIINNFKRNFTEILSAFKQRSKAEQINDDIEYDNDHIQEDNEEHEEEEDVEHKQDDIASTTHKTNIETKKFHTLEPKIIHNSTKFNLIPTTKEINDALNSHKQNHLSDAELGTNAEVDYNNESDNENENADDYYDETKTHHSIVKRQITKGLLNEKIDVITKAEYFIDREFMEKLVDSCRDVKIYGDDALQGICGNSAKVCTGQKMGDFLGLKVDLRPMDIIFTLTDEKEMTVTRDVPISSENHLKKTKQFKIKPVSPQFHACNESYNYGDLEYGAKCSCKACKNSCNLYDELRILKKKEFKIGDMDGVSLIMTILFIIFMITFCHSISFFNGLRYKCKGSNEKSYVNQTLSPCNKKVTDGVGEMLSPADTNDFIVSPMSNEDAVLVKEKGLKSRISKLNFLDQMKYFGEILERFIEMKFTNLGRFCAVYPKLVLFIGLAFCSIMCLGYFNFKIENDPVKLWSSDSSIARQNKKYFDENFGPFYRITQLIIEPKENTIIENYSNNKQITALKHDVLNEAFELYMKINSIATKCIDCEEDEIAKKIRLTDICYQPLWPENKNCATQSIFQYWKNNPSQIRDVLKSKSHLFHLESCMTNPYNSDCLSDFGGPIQPYMIAGSYDGENYLEAKAIVITYVLNNYVKTKNPEAIKKTMAWEAEVLNILQNYTSPLINVYYTTERSIEDELERESKADMKIIGISYVMMFFYLTITLGKYSSFNIRVVLIEMKFFLALSGVILVLLSVFSSGGLFTYLGVPATLITLEVIPFLLLAVGVDNIYVMVQTYQNDERRESESVEDQIARIVGKVGPSMLLTGTTQSAAFLISAMTPMPGVRAFSLYATLAIVLNFLLQITCFVVLLTLDAKREKARRMDMFCCVKFNNLKESDLKNGKKSFLHTWFKEIYTPFLLNNYVRASVIILFVGFFFACISMCDKIKIGLDQKLAMPIDSYQNKYFEALQKHLKVGPPVYFVLKDGYEYADINSLRMLCGASNCDENSLQSIISSASFFSNETYIAQSSVNWIDDYIEWLNSDPFAETSSTCCHMNSQSNKFCEKKALNGDSLHNCHPCSINYTSYNFPTNDNILRYIPHFLKQNPSETCIKAGHAMYGDAVNLKLNNEDHTKVDQIKSSHFMAYHSVLSTSDDFINAMISAQQISEKITKTLNQRLKPTDKQYEVFPYSIFYVFYEQYLKIWQDATAQLVTTLVAIFICTFILLSFDLFTALIITGVIAIIIIDMVGIMYLWDIELNAISLVNLVIAIGISVEFSAHIARAFATSTSKNKKKRASDALCSMGPPVFSGVIQSIVGISVLAFAHSQLFQVFYFRMYFSILVLGLTHGLIFLPVLLSYIGSNAKLISRRGRSISHLKYSDVNNDKASEDSYEKFQETEFKLNRLSKKKVNIEKPVTPQKRDKRTNSSNNKDRDSPTSRKSVDLLLNDHNSSNNELNSNSSNENNIERQEEAERIEIDNNFELNPNDFSINLNDINSQKGSFTSKLNFFRNKYNSPFKEPQISKMRRRVSSNSECQTNGSSNLVINGDYTKTIDVSSYKRLTSKDKTQMANENQNYQFQMDNDDNFRLPEFDENTKYNLKGSTISTPNPINTENKNIYNSAHLDSNNKLDNNNNHHDSESNLFLSQSLNLSRNKNEGKTISQNSNKSLTNLIDKFKENPNISFKK